MTRALFIHASTEVRDKYEAALGCPVTFLNRGSFSAAYSENGGLASEFPTLGHAVRRYMPDLPESEPVILLAFSAGCWTARSWLRDVESRARCAAVLLIDGLHSSSETTLAGVIDYAIEACEGRKTLVLTHSQIRTDLLEQPYHSTRQTADLVIHSVGLARSNYSNSVHQNGFHVLAGDGGDKAAHSRQLMQVGPDACRAYVRTVRDTDRAPMRWSSQTMPSVQITDELREQLIQDRDRAIRDRSS